jgi:hypothetical protein
MTALDNTPVNKNYLSPLNFNFELKRAPHVNFFVQSLNIPGFSFTAPLQQNPFSNIPQVGDRIRYEDLEVTFKVDEDLQNYFEIYNWIRSLGFPENFEEYAQIKALPITGGKAVRSDITVLISNAIKVPRWSVVFRECFPISMSRLNFQTTDTSVNYLSCTATFKYIFFDIAEI